MGTLIRPAITPAVFMAFSAPKEGRVGTMYADSKGYVSTGIGNKIDSIASASALPWKSIATGLPATTSEKAAEWTSVKTRGGGALTLGPDGVYTGALATLRLSSADIDALFASTMTSFATTLSHYFPAFATWPADAQEGGLSMAWACGPAFPDPATVPPWPKFTAAALAQDWATCATECHIDDADNPGVTPRNTANAVLFQNAAVVARGGGDPAVLYYPRVLATGGLAPSPVVSPAAPPAIAAIQRTANSAAPLFFAAAVGIGLAVLFKKSGRVPQGVR